MFRSETMCHYHLVVSKEGAWKLLNTVGNIGYIGFKEKPQIEMNTEFLKIVRGIDDLIKRLLYVEQEAKKLGCCFEDFPDTEIFLKELDKAMLMRSKGEQGYLSEIEEIIIEKTNGLSDLLARFNYIKNRIDLYREEKSVLNHLKETFHDSNYYKRGENCSPRLTMIAGTIPKQDSERLRRMSFRISKGNVIIEITNKKEHDIFVFWFSCIGTDLLNKKIQNLIDSMGGHRIVVPQNNDQLERKLKDIEENINGNGNDIRLTRGFISESILFFKQKNEGWSISPRFQEFMLFLFKEKNLYLQLSQLTIEKMFFHGNCYAEKEREEEILKTIENLASMPNTRVVAQLRSVALIKDDVLPTKFNSPDWTSGAQEITETYSIPKYKELNPSPITMITFPFLFGVMFGDVGHGLLLLIGILALKPKHMPLLLLAAFFSIYCGFIYNEFFSMPIQAFKSCYDRKKGCVYPFGLDSIWLISHNGMTFINSLKMKLSLILGIFHMLLGILFNLLNLIYKSDYASIAFEFIPKLVFFLSLIGYLFDLFRYLTILVIIKWTSVWLTPPPSLFSVFLGIFLHPGVLKKEEEMFDPILQLKIQKIILYLAFFSAVLMFTGKFLWVSLNGFTSRQNQEASFDRSPRLDFSGDFEENHGLLSSIEEVEKIKMENENLYLNKTISEIEGRKSEHEGFNFVHVFLESIEFILGTISHTASYLRLWALSLAHSELARVFLEMGLINKLEHGASPIGVIIGFFAFANQTAVILLGMDAMECFLHSLRLHWVEFQSKFFQGGGKKFKPFSFVKMIDEDKNTLAEFKNRNSRGDIQI